MPKKGIHDCGRVVWDEEKWVWRKKPNPEFVWSTFWSLIKKKGVKAMKKISLFFSVMAIVALISITSASVAFACEDVAVSGNNDAFFTPYVPDGSGAFPNTVIFARNGVKVEGFVPATEVSAIVQEAEKRGLSVDMYLKGIIVNTNKTFTFVTDKNDGTVGYSSVLGYKYNSTAKVITPPKVGSGGNGSGNGKGNGGGPGGQ
jgi:hypothetical protein